MVMGEILDSQGCRPGWIIMQNISSSNHGSCNGLGSFQWYSFVQRSDETPF